MTALEAIEARNAATSCAHCGVLLHRNQPHAPYCIGRAPHGPCLVCARLSTPAQEEQ